MGLQINISAGGDSWQGIYADHWLGQTVTPTTTFLLEKASLYVKRTGTITNFTVSVYLTSGGLPIGNALVSKVVDCSAVGTSGEWKDWTFATQITLSSSVQYAICITGGVNTTNNLGWYADTDDAQHAGGELIVTYDESTWELPSNDMDMYIKVYGAAIPADKTYSRKLIAIANDEVWYESSLGTMSELTDANGNINTANPLMTIEAYQKGFLVNDTNLKVIDFINSKITTADIKPTDKVIPQKGTLLTGGSSTAQMVVDYIDAADNACNVYGFRTTTATFTNGETVTGTVTTTNDVTFVLNAAEDGAPHWYDWTVYSGDATNFGTIPTNAILLALYRGRIVIAGDNNNPHQWWMSKVGNPFKFLYDYTNDGDLSAISYSNTKVGLIGDIITALIAYKDDLLIFGCANSVWILIGDPLGSGQIAKVTDFTGMWGAQSWCIDDKRNLYFLGSDGIYRVPVSETISQPDNISKLTLPNLMSTLDLDKSLHRVVFTFDPVRYGIIISKTLLSNGTNVNYWFDLTTGGFFPETYPEECAIYSSYYYKSTDDTYTKLLVGCQDGYIREFKLTAKDDDIGDTDESISSYVVFPIQLISENEDKEGILTWLNSITAGGASSGDFADTDSVGYSVYVGDDAETVLEDIKDSATAFTTGTWTGTGKQNKNRVRARGCYIGIKLSNSSTAETWAIDKLFGNIEQKGKIK